MKKYYGAIAAIIIIAAMAIVAAASTNGPHVTDRIISDDLDTIHAAIITYATDTNELPPNLSSLTLGSDVKNRVSRYGYNVLRSSPLPPRMTVQPLSAQSSKSKSTIHEPVAPITPTLAYTLCATFKTDTTAQKPSTYSSFNTAIHGVGYQCFRDTAPIWPRALQKPSTK